MKCPKCQNENPETRKFFRECDAKLSIFQSYFGRTPNSEAKTNIKLVKEGTWQSKGKLSIL